MAAAAVVLSLGAAAPAAATVIAWDQGSGGDIWGQSFTGVLADTLSWGGTDTSALVGITGPMAHSHGQTLNWTISATVDGSSIVIYHQFLESFGQQSLADLGNIHFTQGLVTEIDLGCDDCSRFTFHQFDDATMNLTASGAPEPATWALMLGGFGLAGAALRGQKRTTAHA